jgi:lauroyl/myristoyl acyltransferase
MSERPHTERWAYRWLYTSRIFQFTTGLFVWLGRAGFRIVTHSVARFYAATQPAIREVVRQNLALVMDNPTDRDATRVFVNYGNSLGDYVAVGAMSESQVRSLCQEVVGFEHIEAAVKNGRGVILASGHLGFFEYGCVALGMRGMPISVVSQAEPSNDLTEWRARWRRRWNAETVVVGEDSFSSLEIVRVLNSGRCTAVLVDRPISERGVTVRLPHGEIDFSVAPALLSWMTGAPIIPVSIITLPGGNYRLTAHPPITAARVPKDERDAELRRCTLALAEPLIADIRENPLQWYQFVPVGKPL